MEIRLKNRLGVVNSVPDALQDARGRSGIDLERFGGPLTLSK